jgi:hypothetical protein
MAEMAVGSRATTADYNNVQTAISSILGVGSGTSGYGQTLLSSQVVPGAVITATQWNNLRSDLSRARMHQTGNAVTDGLASNSANRGSPYQVLQIISSSTTISDSIRDQYTQFSAGVSSQKDLATELTPNLALLGSQPTVSGSWGGTSLQASRSIVLTVTFAGYGSVSASDHARAFFNAGGALHFTSSRTGTAANSKDTDWTSMLSGIGEFFFKNGSSSLVGGSYNSGGSVATGTGYSGLPASGAGINGGTNLLVQTSSASKYAENRFYIAAKKTNAYTLEFTFSYQDIDAGDRPVPSPPPPYGPLVDEPVTGSINIVARYTQPTGSNVSVNAPGCSAGAWGA